MRLLKKIFKVEPKLTKIPVDNPIKNGRIQWIDYPQLRIRLYQELLVRTGEYSPETHTITGCPVGLTAKEWDLFCKDLCECLNLPRDKSAAIRQQIAWCCTDQKEIKPQQVSTYWSNKLVAVHSGWVSPEKLINLYDSRLNSKGM